MTKNSFSTIPRINMSLITEEEQASIFQLLQKYRVTLTQITPSQNLAVYGLTDDAFERLSKELLTVIEYNKGIKVTYVQNCSGQQNCKYAMADSLSLGRKIEHLTFTFAFPAKVKVSVAGCSMCCTEPYIRDVGVIAKRRGWTVVFGGNGAGKPRIADTIGEALSEQEALNLIKRSLDFYIENGSPRQRTARFIEHYGRVNFLNKIR